MSVMRSLWYFENGEPFEEETSEKIDKKHTDLFRKNLLNGNNESATYNIPNNDDLNFSSDKKRKHLDLNLCFQLC